MARTFIQGYQEALSDVRQILETNGAEAALAYIIANTTEED